MAQLSHAKGGVRVVTGSFTGESTPTIVAGKGTFSVTYAANVYTVVIKGPEPVCQEMVVSLSLEGVAGSDFADAADAGILVSEVTAEETGTFKVRAYDGAGTAGPVEDDHLVHFVAYLHTATETV